MNFRDFLRDLRDRAKITSISAQFQKLGGEEGLGITQRRFAQIANGDTPPSEKLLLALFHVVDSADRKELVCAYFQSVLTRLENSEELIGYVESHLLPSVESTPKKFWDTNPSLYYSDEQMEYLLGNPLAFRFFTKIMLVDHKSFRPEDSGLDLQILRQMSELGLVRMMNGYVLPSRKQFRLPSYGKYNPRSVALANQLILKHIEQYMSFEGSDRQNLKFNTLMVTPEKVKSILAQMEVFRDWLTTLHEVDPNPEAVPIIFVGFIKQLWENEL